MFSNGISPPTIYNYNKMLIIGFINQMMNVIICLILLSSSLLVSVSCQNYDERLQEREQYLVFSFQVKPEQIPFYLQSILEEYSLNQIKILMGFKHSQQLGGELPTNGVQIFLSNRTHFSEDQIQDLKMILLASFAISLHPKFTIFIPEIDAIYSSNPNDKFCTEQFQEVFRNFLPCQNRAGFAKMFTSKILFQERYVGMQILWTSNTFEVTLMVEKSAQINTNLMRVKIQPCKLFDKSQAFDMQNKSLSLNTILLDKMSFRDHSLRKHNNDFIRINRFMIGNWYGVNKHIINQITIKNVETETSSEYLVVLYLILPKGFQYEQTKIINEIEERQLKFEEKLLEDQHRTVIKIKFQVQIGNGESSRISIKNRYESRLPQFQTFEVIGGGGEQFSRVPIIVKSQEKLHLLTPPSISDHLLEPDFSMPFTIITVSVALIGYLIIALWKIYFKQISEEASNANKISEEASIGHKMKQE